MTREEFIKWIDEEMDRSAFVVNSDTYMPEQLIAHANKHFILKQVKEKFLSIVIAESNTP